jgi:hypothetical protein
MISLSPHLSILPQFELALHCASEGKRFLNVSHCHDFRHTHGQLKCDFLDISSNLILLPVKQWYHLPSEKEPIKINSVF